MRKEDIEKMVHNIEKYEVEDEDIKRKMDDKNNFPQMI
jgi:hypothetical protein